MSSTVRVLLVAVCGYGRRYLEEMKKGMDGTELAGIVEVRPDVLETEPWLAQNRIPVYRTVEDFFAVDRADLTVIVSPIHLHTQMVIACLRNGSNVLCEKPLCVTQEEADQMQAEADKAGRFLAVGYQRDYRRDVQCLKREILNGALGKPLRVRVLQGFRRGSQYYARNNWAGKIRVNGHDVFDSPLQNACAHGFQLACFLLGKDMPSACAVTKVDAELYRGNPNVENYDVVALRAHTDVGVPVLFYSAHPIPLDFWGPTARYEFERGTVLMNGREGGDEEIITVVYPDGTTRDISRETGETPYMQKFYDAIRCAREGGTPICGVSAERAHIAAVQLAQKTPVTDIDSAHVDVVETERNGTYWYVHELTEKLTHAAENWSLPREAGIMI